MKSLERSNYQLDCSPVMLIRRASSGMAPRAFFASNRWKKATIAVIVWMTCWLVQARFAVAQNVPSGTIELSGGSVAVGIGFTWGSGKLIYEGKEYPLKVDGISIVQVGASGYTASGTVYDLTKLSDINGVYAAVSAGVAVAGGASAIAMKNSNGVLIQMASTHMGLNFSLGPKGVTIALRKAEG
jgi:hypothetical protein